MGVGRGHLGSEVGRLPLALSTYSWNYLAWQAGGGKGKVWARDGAKTQPSWAAAM